MLPRIYLIRHGETEWSRSGRHTSQTEVPLTAQGQSKARELGGRLRGVKIARVFTRQLQRARQTCELSGVNFTPEIEQALAEWDYGEYEGKTSADIRQSRPDWNVCHHGCP